jgi:hypothetical protein
VPPPPIGPGKLLAPKIAISGGNLNFTVQPSVAGRRYQLQSSDTMASGTWQALARVSYDEAAALDFAGIRCKRHYKVVFISFFSSGPFRFRLGWTS